MAELNYSNMMASLLNNKEDFRKFLSEYNTVCMSKRDKVGSEEYTKDTAREFKRMSGQARNYLERIFPNEAESIRMTSDEDICHMFYYVFNPLR